MMNQEKNRVLALDYTKAVLIFFIVLGHNDLLMQQFQTLRWFIYNWHVYGFLLVAFVPAFRWWQDNFIADRAARYLIPFAIFFTVSWIGAFVVGGWWQNPLPHVSLWAQALVIGSADLLDAASGARLFWFLPALLGIVLIRWSSARLGRVGAVLLGFIAVGGFLWSGLIPPDYKVFLPLGLPIALYALGPCLVFLALSRWCIGASTPTRAAASIASLLIFFLCTWLASEMHTGLVLASFRYYDIEQPVALINHAILAITATLFILSASTFLPELPTLAWIGNSSLIIYLSHQIIYLPVRILFTKIFIMNSILAGLLSFIVTFAIAIGVSYFILSSERWRRFISPRSFSDWVSSFTTIR